MSDSSNAAPAPRNKGATEAVTACGGDVVFFTVKDLSHGIIGKAADGTMAGPHYDAGFGPKKP